MRTDTQTDTLIAIDSLRLRQLLAMRYRHRFFIHVRFEE